MPAIYKNGKNYGGGTTVDSALSSTSTNPVQNKVVKQALDELILNFANYYNKTEVDNIVNTIKNSRFEAVETLPTTDIKTNVIYLVPKSSAQTNNVKDEYINLDGTSSGWEKIGDTEIDLSGYVTTTALNTALSDYTTTTDLTALLNSKVDKVAGKGLSTNDYTNEEKQKNADNASAIEDIQEDISRSLTATGNPITIESSESNLVECVAEVEAVQDLHGYDHPWVGGAGKNILPLTVNGIKSLNASGTWSGNVYTLNGVTFTIQTDNDGNVIGIKAKKISSSSNYASLILDNSNYSKYAGKSLILNGGINSYNYVYFYRNDGAGSVSATGSDSSFNAREATPSSWNVAIIVSVESTINDSIFYPMIRLSTETDATFAPYTNISPITGQTEVVVEDCGKNLFDPVQMLNVPNITVTDGVYSFSKSDMISTFGNGKYFKLPKFKENTQYTFSMKGYTERSSWSLKFYYTDGSANSKSFSNTSMEQLFITSDAGKTVDYVDFSYASYGQVYWKEIQFEKGSTATTYEPYKGKTYTIQLGDTIYGGSVDVVNGVMTVDRAMVDLGSCAWDVRSESVIRCTVSAEANFESQYKAVNGICSAYIIVAQNSLGDGKLSFNNSTQVYLQDNNHTFSTQSDAQQYLNGQKLVYELATPYTIKLTPQQIRMLKGTNNISCNTGNLTIKYYPDNVLGQLKGDIESEYDARFERLEQYTDVFGFIEDMDVLSPTERIKYIGKNENYEPLTVDLNTGSYTLGDWGDFPFLVDNKPYMVKPDGTPDYQLNEYDYTKKLDGTDSDVANENYDGGAFSWGRKIYKKQWMVGNKRHVLFSFDKKDGFHADGFINKDGKELDGRWIPMFYGTVVNGKAKSVATGNCITGGNLTTDAQHNTIVAFDSNANFFGGAFVETLIDLLMMFAKNSDLQAAYGYGNSSGYVNDSSKNYGMLNNAVVGGGQFYGRSGGKTLNKALHSIVLATYNSYMRDPYEVIKNGKVVVSEDYTYDPTGATYTDTGITVPDQSANAWRYPKKYIAVPRYGSIPDISVGGASTSLGRADGTYILANQSVAVIVCLRFGDCGRGASAGLSCRYWCITASDTWWNLGFALLLDGSAVA